MPANATLAAGTSVQLHASGFFSDGSAQDLTASVAWAASSGLSVTPAGLLFGGHAGGRGRDGNVIRGDREATENVSSATLGIGCGGARRRPGRPRAPARSSPPPALLDGSTQDLTSSASWSSTASGVAG